MITDKKEIVIPRDEIAQRVKELGAEITRDFTGCELVVVGVMNGAFIFAADLVREIKLPLAVDFVRLASYGTGTCSSGKVDFIKDIELSIEGKDVLIVEDIVDTGRTLAAICEIFKDRKARSTRICALIDKKERREEEVTIHYVGFEVAEGFLIGYGLDCAEKYRNFPDVYRLLTK